MYRGLVIGVRYSL